MSASAYADDLGVGRAVEIVEKSLTILNSETIDAGGILIGNEPAKFASAKISLSTQLKLSADSKVSFKIIELGSNVSSAEAQKIQVTLVPPKEGETVPEAGDDTARKLAAVLLQATNELSDALKDSKRLHPGSVSVTIKFALENEVGGGVGFKVFGIGFDVSADVKESEIQEITLNFE